MSDQGMPEPLELTVQCAYCAGMMPAGEIECPRCGAPVEESFRTDGTQEEALEEFLERSHEKLIKAGTSGAELAFGVGCTLEVLVAGLIMLVIFLVFTKTWTILAVILFILMLISILISSILSIRAREAATRSTYYREVKPEIERFNTFYGLSEDEFRVQAAEILPEDSPVLQYSTENAAKD